MDETTPSSNPSGVDESVQEKLLQPIIHKPLLPAPTHAPATPLGALIMQQNHEIEVTGQRPNRQKFTLKMSLSTTDIKLVYSKDYS